MNLSPQQRGILETADRLDYVTARTFEGSIKGWPNPRYRAVTMSSASAALRRLADRGLLAYDEKNRGIFRITDEGREALS